MKLSEDDIQKLLETVASQDRGVKASRFTVGTLTWCLEEGLIQQVGDQVNITSYGSEVLQYFLIHELTSSQE